MSGKSHQDSNVYGVCLAFEMSKSNFTGALPYLRELVLLSTLLFGESQELFFRCIANYYGMLHDEAVCTGKNARDSSSVQDIEISLILLKIFF
jgi:hypothetical protein